MQLLFRSSSSFSSGWLTSHQRNAPPSESSFRQRGSLRRRKGPEASPILPPGEKWNRMLKIGHDLAPEVFFCFLRIVARWGHDQESGPGWLESWSRWRMLKNSPDAMATYIIKIIPRIRWNDDHDQDEGCRRTHMPGPRLRWSRWSRIDRM